MDYSPLIVFPILHITYRRLFVKMAANAMPKISYPVMIALS